MFLYFQLFFYDYTKTECLDTSHAAAKTREAFSEAADSSAPVIPYSTQMEMEDLRQQIQMLKNQAMIALDQGRKSLEREKLASLEAQKSANLEQIATAEATRAAEREQYMIELMTTASQDVAGTYPSFRIIWLKDLIW